MIRIRDQERAAVHDPEQKAARCRFQRGNPRRLRPRFPRRRREARPSQQPYSVTGTTIRTKLKGRIPSFPPRPMRKRSSTRPGANPETRNSPGGPRSGSWANGAARKSEWRPRKWNRDSATKKSRVCWSTRAAKFPLPMTGHLLGRGMDQRNRRIRRRRHGSETLRRKDAAPQCCRSDESAGHNSAGARPQMAVVDVLRISPECLRCRPIPACR